MRAVPVGIRIIFPHQENLDLTNIKTRSCLKLTLDLPVAAVTDGLFIGLEDQSGFRSEHLLEAYVHRGSRANGPHAFRIPLSDFSSSGVHYTIQGQPEWSAFDFKNISAITLTATAVPITMRLHTISIETQILY